VFGSVVRAARQLLDADRASLLLVEDGGLAPAVSIARKGDDEQLWARFRSMPPVRLDINPRVQRALANPRLTVIEDASTSDLIPADWREAFGLTSIALMPLVVRGTLYGLLAVDHAEGPHPFSDEELRTLEGIGALASHAVHVARARQQADNHLETVEQVLSIAVRLNAADTLASVLDTAAEAFLTLLGGHACTIAVLEPDDALVVLASRGRDSVTCGRYGADELSAEDRKEFEPHSALPSLRVWAPSEVAAGHPGLLSRTAGDGRLLIVPFVESSRARGFAFVGIGRESETAQETLFYAMSLANHVWLSMSRARDREHLERQLDFLQELNGLSDDIVIQPDMRLIVERLAPILRQAANIEILDVVVRNPQVAKLFGTTTPRGIVAQELRRLGHGHGPRWVRQGALLIVPLLVEGEVIGALQARSQHAGDPSSTDVEFLISCASHLAALVARTALRTRVAGGEREIAVAEERARSQQRLQHVLGQRLAQIRGHLQELHDSYSPTKVHDLLILLQRAEAQLREEDLSPRDVAMTESQTGLHSKVRKLVESENQVDATFRVRGTAGPVSAEAQAALLRLTTRWLALARRARSPKRRHADIGFPDLQRRCGGDVAEPQRPTHPIAVCRRDN
jgi:GAF domain-containing protein